MHGLKLKVYAKINLSLNVTGTLPDGFHAVDTVMQSVGIFDTLSVKKRGDRLCSARFEDGTEVLGNTALKAAELFVKSFNTMGADITIRKGIPLSGGMGGSSADAAGVLAALCALYGVPCRDAQASAERLGSDTKFMLKGGLVRAKGKGGELEFFEPGNPLYFVVLKPPFGLDTGEVYKRFDLVPDFTATDNAGLVGDLKLGNIQAANEKIFNALQKPALDFYPAAKEFFGLASRTAGAAKISMTGSGSCFFALCGGREESAELCGKLKRAGFDAAECASVPEGIEFF